MSALRGLRAAAAVLFLLSPGLGCVAAEADDSTEVPGLSDREAAVGDGIHFTLWIHGRSTGGSASPDDYEDFSYWGPSSEKAGVSKKAVNWDGVSRISDTNGSIRRALDCFCTGEHWCYVAAHSAGNVQIGYALDLYGGSKRPIQDAQPNASGQCGSSGGTQVGWNLKWVDVAGGAAGGTELADLGYWAVSDPLTSDLRTKTARSMYNHNNTGAAIFYMFAGAKGTAYSGVLPGQDDEVIAYHSSGGMAGTGSFCNPGDYFCDDTLEYGSGGSKKDGGVVQKWSRHVVMARDDSESLDHYTDGAWAGVVSGMAKDMADYAK